MLPLGTHISCTYLRNYFRIEHYFFLHLHCTETLQCIETFLTANLGEKIIKSKKLQNLCYIFFTFEIMFVGSVKQSNILKQKSKCMEYPLRPFNWCQIIELFKIRSFYWEIYVINKVKCSNYILVFDFQEEYRTRSIAVYLMFVIMIQSFFFIDEFTEKGYYWIVSAWGPAGFQTSRINKFIKQKW